MSDRPVIDESMDEIIQEFLAESVEGLDQFDRDVVALEADPTSVEHLGSAFRIFHTIKGTSGFLGFDTLEELTHGAESLLAKLRDGELRLTTARTNVLLDVGDTIRTMLLTIEQTGADGSRDIADLVHRLEALQQDTEAQFSSETRSAPEESSPLSEDDADPDSGSSTSAPDVAGQPQAGSPPAANGRPASPGGRTGSPDHPAAPAGSASAHMVERSVRLDVDLLDNLMRQVGELVLARNEVVAVTDPSSDTALHQTVQRLSLIVSELQEGVMKTRMQPLTQLWLKLPRIVRDTATSSGKEVLVEMDGGETELDRSVLEAVRDPFMHMLRNAVDHGIESPDDREAMGKSRAGRLSIRAFYEGGYVIMEVADDGRGIDPARIGAKALQMGLINPERLDAMSERDLVDLIFAPGFSTADAITSVSGRGVGMDVVRSNIESIGGTVDVVSAVGIGTTFRFKIPLTLAIIPALLIACHGNRYAIPQPNLVEMLHIGTQASPAVVERIDQATVIRLRGHLLPLVRLDEIFGFVPVDGLTDHRAIVAVLQAGDLRFGLVFDEVFETQEIVVKPLDSLVKEIDAFAGATILGDGSVALILDVGGLAAVAGLQETTLRLSAAGYQIAEADEDEREKTAFVVLRVGESRTIAIPVEQIARLEEIQAATVEKSGEIDVVQYRGTLMRLVRLHEVLGVLGHPTTPEAPLKVVVHESEHGTIGFVVAELLDVLEDVVDLADIDSGYGLAGAVVLHGRVTDVLDLDTAILWMQREGFFAEAR